MPRKKITKQQRLKLRAKKLKQLAKEDLVRDNWQFIVNEALAKKKPKKVRVVSQIGKAQSNRFLNNQAARERKVFGGVVTVSVSNRDSLGRLELLVKEGR